MNTGVVRVLHVVGQMNRGGVETWLVQLLRAADPARLRMDFVTSTASSGAYDADIARLGGAVFPCERPTAPARYARTFRRVLREHGPYQVVHAHLHHFSGLPLALAARAGVPVRVAHSHLDTRRLDAAAALPRRAYLSVMAGALRRWATHGLAASDVAAEALFGPRWREDPRCSIVRCGLDFSPFRAHFDPRHVRASLGIAPDALAVGHVGRFDPQKNHAFLVQAFEALARRAPNAMLVLVGAGPLQQAVEADVARRGLAERVVFAGVRPDVPDVLRALDVFLFPSHHEGLPLAMLEAQAAGLPIVLSDTITREVELLPELVSWRSLRDPPDVWAEAIQAAVGRRSRRDPVAVLERSAFSVHRSLAALLEVYAGPAERAARST